MKRISRRTFVTRAWSSAAICLAVAARPAAVTSVDQRPHVTLATADSALIATALVDALDGAKPSLLRRGEWDIVNHLYRGTDSSAALVPLWIEGARFAPRARDLVAVLAASDSLGLEPNDYGVAALDRLLSAADGADAQTLARGDVLLTARFVALLDDLLIGRVDPRMVERGWHIRPNRAAAERHIVAASEALRGGTTVSALLATLRPDYGAYRPLAQALARYRDIAHAGGWPRVPDGPVLSVGDTAPVVAVLRNRLAAEGYTIPIPHGDVLDSALAGTLAEFQRRHGLTVDSVLGPHTREALNVSAAYRKRQIEANLERLRWLPMDLGDRFVVVNIPAFSLYAYAGGQRVLTMRVVVGDELVGRHTPIFADTLEYVQFGPYWNVPRSIAVREILPAARRDRDYLARNHFQILRGWGDDAPLVDPTSLSDAALFSSRYRVRQLPGPDNALGRVKFMFPNDYNVYLHDTPARTLFEDAQRAHSHGCVRVADPQALAEFVLHDRPDWPPDRIASALATGNRERVQIKPAVPVYLVYLTVFAREGQIAFRDDIYDRDDALIRVLASGGR